VRRSSADTQQHQRFEIWIRQGYEGQVGVAILLGKVPRSYDSEGPFRSSNQAATCYYQSNHSKVEAIPVSAFLLVVHVVAAVAYTNSDRER